jgi:L-rhamnose isomerase
MQKAILYALLMPHKKLRELQDNARFTELMMLNEELKTYPFGEVWQYFCEVNNVPAGREWFEKVREYEQKVLIKRY